MRSFTGTKASLHEERFVGKRLLPHLLVAFKIGKVVFALCRFLSFFETLINARFSIPSAHEALLRTLSRNPVVADATVCQPVFGATFVAWQVSE